MERRKWKNEGGGGGGGGDFERLENNNNVHKAQASISPDRTIYIYEECAHATRDAVAADVFRGVRLAPCLVAVTVVYSWQLLLQY